jgi:hypothetical protein
VARDLLADLVEVLGEQQAAADAPARLRDLARTMRRIAGRPECCCARSRNASTGSRWLRPATATRSSRTRSAPASPDSPQTISTIGRVSHARSLPGCCSGPYDRPERHHDRPNLPNLPQVNSGLGHRGDQVKNLTPTSGPHCRGIAARVQLARRRDAHAIPRPTGGRRPRPPSRACQRGAQRRGSLRGAAPEVDRRRCSHAARSLPRRGHRDVAPDPSPWPTMTGAHRSPRAALWLPGLAVALGAAVATAHGVHEVALAAAVAAGIAWLYHLITEGLALVAYGATCRLIGSAARYARAVAVIAAGLSGLASRLPRLRRHPGRLPNTSFRIRAWPAVAAAVAVAAHLLYPLTAHGSTEPRTRSEPDEVTGLCQRPAGSVRPFSRPPPLPDALDVIGRPSPGPTSRSSEPSTDPAILSIAAVVSPVRARARAAALRHAVRHGLLPTVSAPAAVADISRGIAATVLKPLRGHPLPPS